MNGGSRFQRNEHFKRFLEVVDPTDPDNLGAFAVLSPAITLEIFWHLNAYELVNSVARTCKFWNRLANINTLWRRLSFKRFRNSGFQDYSDYPWKLQYRDSLLSSTTTTTTTTTTMATPDPNSRTLSDFSGDSIKEIWETELNYVNNLKVFVQV